MNTVPELPPRPRLDDKQRFLLSPLAQTIPAINDPSAALKLLDQKKKQYEDMQRRADQVQNRRILRLFQKVTEEKTRIERMPIVRKSPRRRKDTWSVMELGRDRRSESPGLIPGMVGFWKKLHGELRRPESREGAVMLSIGPKSFLIGGSSRGILNDLWVLYSLNPQWTKAAPHGPDPEPRMGHSIVEYQHNLLVFGGVTSFNPGGLRSCLNTVKMLKTDTMEWRQVDTQGISVTMRRYHSAAIVGKHMVVYGGLSEKNVFLDDLLTLNLVSMKWKKVVAGGLGPGPLAFHGMVAAYPGFLPEKMKLFEVAEVRHEEVQFPVQSPGIYLFGGLDPSSQAHNTLFVLQTGQRPLAWTQVPTSGKVPSARLHHTFSLCKELNAIVLFGGRDNTKVGGGYSCFGDLHLLDLATLTWAEIALQGDIPSDRCAHASTTMGLQLVLFGGVDGSKYCPSDTFILELDQKVAFDCIRDRERQHRRALELQKAHEKEKVKHSARASLGSRSVAFGGSAMGHHRGETSLL